MKRSRDESFPEANPHMKRKVVLLVAYNGLGFSGLQKQPDGIETIESTLEAAIHRAGGISDENYGTLQKVSWSRAGRTDKGVHALGQIISLKMVLAPEPMLERINAQLEGHAIRVLDYVRTNNNFCAHTACSSREYEYLLPVSVLLGDEHDAVAAAAVATGSSAVPAAESAAAAAAADSAESASAAPSPPPPPVSEEALDKLRALLRQYEGTHSFHNFTDPKVEPTDKSASRYMISFTTAPPVVLAGKPYVPLRFHGQSFLLHQIRKMVALACAAFRGFVPPDAIATALRPERIAPVPMAPSCALILRRCFYASYERKRLAEFPERGSVHFPSLDAPMDAFLQARILPHVAECEAAGEFRAFTEVLRGHTLVRQTPWAHGPRPEQQHAAAAMPAEDAGE